MSPYTITKGHGARPYKIRRGGRGGRVVGTSRTLKAARASVRARMAAKRG